MRSSVSTQNYTSTKQCTTQQIHTVWHLEISCKTLYHFQDPVGTSACEISKYQPSSKFDKINIRTHLGIVTNFKKQLSKFPFLWDVTLRQCVIGFRSCEGSYCSHIQGSVGHRIFLLSSILLLPLDF